MVLIQIFISYTRVDKVIKTLQEGTGYKTTLHEGTQGCKKTLHECAQGYKKTLREGTQG